MAAHVNPVTAGLAGRVTEASGEVEQLPAADAVVLESRYGDTNPLVADAARLLADRGRLTN